LLQPSAERYSREELGRVLRSDSDRAAAGKLNNHDDLVTLEPDTDGWYTVSPPDVDGEGLRGETTEDIDDRRQVIFLDAARCHLEEASELIVGRLAAVTRSRQVGRRSEDPADHGPGTDSTSSPMKFRRSPGKAP
jgi:hypothetical protein